LCSAAVNPSRPLRARSLFLSLSRNFPHFPSLSLFPLSSPTPLPPHPVQKKTNPHHCSPSTRLNEALRRALSSLLSQPPPFVHAPSISLFISGNTSLSPFLTLFPSSSPLPSSLPPSLPFFSLSNHLPMLIPPLPLLLFFFFFLLLPLLPRLAYISKPNTTIVTVMVFLLSSLFTALILRTELVLAVLLFLTFLPNPFLLCWYYLTVRGGRSRGHSPSRPTARRRRNADCPSTRKQAPPVASTSKPTRRYPFFLPLVSQSVLPPSLPLFLPPFLPSFLPSYTPAT
jgi:hypothetical protein